MVIDCHAHLMPQSWFHPKSPKSIFDLDALFREQDQAGVDITVFGNNWIRSPEGADPVRVVQEFNQHAAELSAKHPKRLIGLACSVPYDNDKILKETEKAIREYKLKGIMIGSSTNGAGAFGAKPSTLTFRSTRSESMRIVSSGSWAGE